MIDEQIDTQIREDTGDSLDDGILTSPVTPFRASRPMEIRP